MNSVGKWLLTAEKNGSVWLGDVREQCALDPEAVPLTLGLDCFDGARRCYPLGLPVFADNRERAFVKEYVSAAIYNLLAGVGGTRLTLYVPVTAEAARELLEEVRQQFLDPASPYNKPVRVVVRMCEALGKPPFRLELGDTRQCGGALPAKSPVPRLRACVLDAVREAERGFYCGIDIGGTDIKLITARDGKIETVSEFDWNPAAYPVAEEISGPVVRLVREAAGEELLDGIGVSFPDVCIRDRVVGGETPKTRGMRENTALDYETEFKKLGNLAELLRPLCREDAPIRMVNDGHMAAITAAAELAGEETNPLDDGIVAFAIGTGLGTGIVLGDGTVPEQPAEYYDILLDLGSYPARRRSPGDLRCVCGDNSGLAGISRYVDQSSAFRYAEEINPALLEGFTREDGGVLRISSEPDLRKPCLEHLMRLAQAGNPEAAEVFRRVGRGVGQVCREMDYLIHPESSTRYVFGRFAKMPACFAALEAGCREVYPRLRLLPAGDDMAETPLMRRLAADPEHTVAQFGQAIGAIYYCLMK